MLRSARTSAFRASVFLAFSASAAMLAGCVGSNQSSTKSMTNPKPSRENFSQAEYGVKASPRFKGKSYDFRRGGGRDQIGKPYKVRGVWYYPKEEKSYSKVGIASWYGDAFHGRLTANGEIYDQTHLTAAHPTMPLPSYARVTNVRNGSSIVVRVNDRGPYTSGRIIDLSRRAAEMLDYTHSGVAQVKVEYLGRARLDGQDEQYLLASYQLGNRAPDPSDGLPTGVMVAMNGSTPSASKTPAFPGALTDAAPQAAMVAVPPKAAQPSYSIAPLPASGPIVPERPFQRGGTQVASVIMSYAEGPVAPNAFAVLDGSLSEDRAIASWKGANSSSAGEGRDAPFILAGTFGSRDEALGIVKALSRFGRVSLEKSEQDGQDWYTVNLYTDGSTPLDGLLEAAWGNGAPDAIAVRD